MNMVIPNEGKLLLAYWAFGTDGSDLEDFVVDLFSSNTTVADASTGADFTISTFAGYLQVPVGRADFSAPTIVANQANINDPTPPAFTSTDVGGQLAYGWIMRGDTSGKIICGQNFDVPRNMVNGTTETLTPFTIKDQTLH